MLSVSGHRRSIIVQLGAGKMTFYRQVGQVPPKRHTQFRKPDGGLYYEELMGEEGFSSDSSLLYHSGVPAAIVDSQVWDLPDLHPTPNHPLKPGPPKLHHPPKPRLTPGPLKRPALASAGGGAARASEAPAGGRAASASQAPAGGRA